MDLLNIVIRSDTSGADKATVALDKTTAAAGRAGQATSALANTFRMLAPLVGAAMAAFSVRAISQQADAWAELQARAVNATGSIEAGTAVMGRLERMARSTYSSLDQTAESWLNNATSLSAMGISIEKQLDLVQSLNDAMVISATRGQKAESVQRAWANAMALGELRGTNLNAVLIGSDRLAQALADSMGVGVNELRKLGAEGKITRRELIGLTSQMEKLAQEAGEMPATLGDARTIWGNTITAIVGLMDQAFGASERLASSLIGLADRVRAGADEFIHWALVASNVLAPAFSLIGSGLDAVSSYAGVALAALAGFFTPVVLGGIASLTWAIGVALVGAVRTLTLALLANPLGLFIGAVAAGVVAAFQFHDAIREAIGVDLVQMMKDAVNLTVGVFVGGYSAITAEWRNFPAVIGDFGARAGQAFVGGIVEGLNKALEKLREWASLLGPFASVLRLGGINIGEYLPTLKIDTPEVYNPWKDQAGESRANIAAIFEEAFSKDYINILREVAAGTRTVEEATVDLSKALEGANDNLGKADKNANKLAEAYKRIVDGAQEFVRAQQLEAGLIGMTEQAANALRYEFDLLNEARRAGITLTDADRAGFTALAQAMAEAEERARSLRDMFDFTKSTIKGFFSDLRSGIDQGKGFWESFADAGVNALQKIADKLIEMALDEVINSFLRNVLGGLFGGFGRGILSPGSPMNAGLGFRWANGGAFDAGNVIPFANGGAFTNSIVDRPTLFPFAKGIGLMGEAGPEAIMPLKRGPDGRLGVSAANQNRGVVVNIQNYGTSKEFDVEQIGPDEVRIIARDEVGRGLERYEKGSLGRFAKNVQEYPTRFRTR